MSSFDDAAIEKALSAVRSMTVVIEAGDRFTGTVTKVMPFGAYIALLPGKEGWLHVSEVEIGRTNKIEDVLKEGDVLEVVVTEKGRNENQFRVSRRNVMIEDQGLTKEQVAEIVKASALEANDATSDVSASSGDESSGQPKVSSPTRPSPRNYQNRDRGRRDRDRDGSSRGPSGGNRSE